jgi:hypothetical protein
MAVSNQQVAAWLASNPGVSDAQIAAAMTQFGVTPAQIAAVTGVPESQVAARVDAVLPPSNWDYDKYQKSLRSGDADYQQELSKLGGVMGVNAQNVYREILAQQQAGTAPAWYAGNTASPQAAAADYALRLAQNGIGSLSQLGQSTVQSGFDSESGTFQETPVLINKATGEPLPRQDLLGRGTRGLDIDYNIEFAPDGTALPYTGNRESTWMGLREGFVKPAAALAAAAYGASLLGGAGAAGAGAAGTGVTGMGLGTGISAGAGGLGLSTTGAAGLGINAGAGLTGTGILSGSTLGTGLLGAGAGAAGLAGLTGTGVLSGSTLGTGLLGTTGTGALTGTGILTGSELGTALLGTGPGTAATVGGVGGSLGANLGAGALSTGIGTGAGSALSAGLAGAGGATGLPAGTGGLLSQALPSALQLGGGLLQSQTDRDAAQAGAASINAATQQAVQGAQFRPIGMTTRFGTSQFQYDPVTGQMTGAGYQLTPEARAAQDRFAALANQGITQAEAAQQQFAPLQTGAQSLFSLGNQYLAQSPQDVAQNYINQQMALLQPGRELELANLQNRLQQQGRAGLSVAQGGAMGATTPELQALYNARAQQEALLAANAQQAGQQNVTFGAGLLGTGATTLGNFYAGQQAAYAPYTSAMGQVTGLETAAQQPFTMSTGLAQQVSQAGANAGQLGLRGATSAADISMGRAATSNPFADLLYGVGSNNALAQGIQNIFGR